VIRDVRPQFGPGIRERLDWAETVSASAVAENGAKWDVVKARIDEVLGEGDVLCLPSSPRIAPARDTEISEKEETFRYQAMCLLCIAGLGGLPQVSLPLATLDGMPVGLSLVGPRGADTQLLALSRELMAGV
jgi:amidase